MPFLQISSLARERLATNVHFRFLITEYNPAKGDVPELFKRAGSSPL